MGWFRPCVRTSAHRRAHFIIWSFTSAWMLVYSTAGFVPMRLHSDFHQLVWFTCDHFGLDSQQPVASVGVRRQIPRECAAFVWRLFDAVELSRSHGRLALRTVILRAS